MMQKMENMFWFLCYNKCNDYMIYKKGLKLVWRIREDHNITYYIMEMKYLVMKQIKK